MAFIFSLWIVNFFRFSVQIKSNISKLAKSHKYWGYNKSTIDVQTLGVQISMVLSLFMFHAT